MNRKRLRIGILIFILLLWLNGVSENSYDNFMAEQHGVIINTKGPYKVYEIEGYGEFTKRATYRNDVYLLTIYHTTFSNSDFENKDDSVTFKHFKFAGNNFDYTDEEENDWKFLKTE